VTDSRVVGRYEILRELGRGGTATVYLARQTDLGRLVALKELSALPVSDPATARRFVRESRLAGSLNHPNIVTVHDFFEDHATPYIAMEYLERGSLRPLMRSLTFAQIAGVLEGVLAGLGHAQDHGIVHRDLKPENLMVTADGRVKIADFGIAKVTDEAHAGTVLTMKGTTIGTPTYMAPEQAMAQDIGPWTDLYAVGIIAFELLAGRPPFDTSGAPMAILLRHVNEPPLELRAVDPRVDPRLSDWVAGLLERAPEQRRHSASAAWMALEEVVIDRLGPRWRHSARLLDARATPPTVPLAREGSLNRWAMETAPDPRGVATAAPRLAAPVAVGAAAAAAARRPAAAARRSLPGRRVAAPILLVMAALLAGAVLALAAMNGPDGGARPTGSPTTTPSQSQRRDGTGAANGSQRRDNSGVGDSRSDDPSDDEPDVGEP
jgi:Protein kinase domain